MGGGQALDLCLGNLDTFANVAGFSSAPSTRAPEILVSDPAKATDKLKVLWFSCGNKGGLMSFSLRTHTYLRPTTSPTSGMWTTPATTSTTGKPASTGRHSKSSNSSSNILQRSVSITVKRTVYILRGMALIGMLTRPTSLK